MLGEGAHPPKAGKTVLAVIHSFIHLVIKNADGSPDQFSASAGPRF